jgi:hypothetical protein
MHHNRRGFVRLSGAAASLAALGLWAGPARRAASRSRLAPDREEDRLHG